MQQAKQATFKQFVLAGSNLAQRDKIMVSSHVTLENPDDQDGRDRYVAQGAVRAGRTISLKWTGILLSICVVICLMMVGGKLVLTKSLEAEYAHLSARYQAAQAEQQRLQVLFDEKSDASGICYYAVQALGMRLAGPAETITLQAAGLPVYPGQGLLRGSAGTGH